MIGMELSCTQSIHNIKIWAQFFHVARAIDTRNFPPQPTTKKGENFVKYKTSKIFAYLHFVQ